MANKAKAAASEQPKAETPPDSPAVTPPVVSEDPFADETETAAEAEDAPVTEPPANIVEGFVDGDTLVPISHPDGGTIDGVEQDDDGNFLVRVIDAERYAAHGFVVAAGDA